MAKLVMCMYQSWRYVYSQVGDVYTAKLGMGIAKLGMCVGDVCG
jgi:hypothetical protein